MPQIWTWIPIGFLLLALLACNEKKTVNQPTKGAVAPLVVPLLDQSKVAACLAEKAIWEAGLPHLRDSNELHAILKRYDFSQEELLDSVREYNQNPQLAHALEEEILTQIRRKHPDSLGKKPTQQAQP